MGLKKKYGIFIACSFLLVLYVGSIIPTFITHHHDIPNISYEQATACEKVILFGQSDHACHHRQHFSEAMQKCWFCDHHTTTPFVLSKLQGYVKDLQLNVIEYVFYGKAFAQISFFHFNRRGPPSN